jgi:hypothetical protein
MHDYELGAITGVFWEEIAWEVCTPKFVKQA